jgi:hypothetical protein
MRAIDRTSALGTTGCGDEKRSITWVIRWETKLLPPCNATRRDPIDGPRANPQLAVSGRKDHSQSQAVKCNS